MSDMPAKRLAAILALALVVSGCSASPPAFSDRQIDDAWDACSGGFDARPEVVQKAWDDEYKARWSDGKLWWRYGGGDICDDLKRDMSTKAWVTHTDNPSWYVDQYLKR